LLRQGSYRLGTPRIGVISRYTHPVVPELTDTNGSIPPAERGFDVVSIELVRKWGDAQR
jgi:hypothetical protein